VIARGAGAALAFAVALVGVGCAGFGPAYAPTPELHLHDLVDQGDATRRASLRIVLDGLRADAAGDAERAQGLYQRALQVDSSNPYAYLALARQSVERSEPELALEYIDRAEDLLASEPQRSPGADAHLDGLRGAALTLEGERVQGSELLERAAQRAPDVWSDAHLDAAELR
jgi:tetratricopeptide (TPR) repeat protein